MTGPVYWAIHVVVGILGLVLSAISVRLTITVLLVLFAEFFGLIGMALPGGANLAFPAEFFGGLGLLMGVPLSLGRGRLDWWLLPAVAAGAFIVLRFTLLFGEDRRTVLVGGLQMLVAALALGGGMLAGRGLTALTSHARRAATGNGRERPV